MRWVMALLLLGISGAAPGADSARARYIEGYCSNGQMEYQTVIASLRYIDETLPHVPPDESRYFQEENSAIIAASSSNADASTQAALARRFDRMVAHRLFYVWQARRQLPDLIIEVQGVESPGIELKAASKGKFDKPFSLGMFANEDANQLLRALIVSSDLGELQASITDLLDHEELHNSDPLFSAQQFQTLGFRAGLLVSDMNEYAKCELVKIAPLKRLY